MKNSLSETNRLHKALKTLCILTIIGSTLYLLGAIFVSFMNSDILQEHYISYIEKAGNSPERFLEMYDHATSIGIIKTFLYGISILGAIYMYCIKINGLYIYAFAQLAVLFVKPIFKDMSSFSFLELILAIVWITAYTSIFYFISKKIKITNEEIIE